MCRYSSELTTFALAATLYESKWRRIRRQYCVFYNENRQPIPCLSICTCAVSVCSSYMYHSMHCGVFRIAYCTNTIFFVILYFSCRRHLLLLLLLSIVCFTFSFLGAQHTPRHCRRHHHRFIIGVYIVVRRIIYNAISHRLNQSDLCQYDNNKIICRWVHHHHYIILSFGVYCCAGSSVPSQSICMWVCVCASLFFCAVMHVTNIKSK